MRETTGDKPVNDDTHKLLVKLLEGDHQAAGILYAMYADPFYRAAKQRGLSDQDADEVVTTTLLRKVLDATLEATSKAKYDPAKGGGERWMWTVFRNTVRDKQRANQMRKALDELTDDLIENVPAPASEFDDPIEYTRYQEVKENVARALQRLSKADLDEILKGRGGRRGPARAAYREAIEHWRTLYHQIDEGAG